MLLFISAAAVADDVDVFKGLNWAEVSAEDSIYMLGISPTTMPEDKRGEPFRVLVPEDSRTRYGEVLAHVMMPDGSWLQNTLVSEGRAIVMPVFELDDTRLQFLLSTENEARSTRKGLWQKNPVVCVWGAKRAFDTFSIVQGPIALAANVRGTIYLNFGEDYRDDFTIKITKSVFNKLQKDAQAKITALTEAQETGTIVEARGWVFYSGGPMIEVKTPSQVRFLEDGHANILERCRS